MEKPKIQPPSVRVTAIICGTVLVITAAGFGINGTLTLLGGILIGFGADILSKVIKALK